MDLILRWHYLLRHQAARMIENPNTGCSALRHLLSCCLTLPFGYKPWQKHSFSVKQKEGDRAWRYGNASSQEAPGTGNWEINTASVLEKQAVGKSAQGEVARNQIMFPVPVISPARQVICLQKPNYFCLICRESKDNHQCTLPRVTPTSQ